MSRKKFFTILFCIILASVFATIYQHNILIKLNYKKQRLKQTKRKLKRKKEHLAITLFELKNYERIENIARENLRMKPLTTSQVVTVHNRKNIKRP